MDKSVLTVVTAVVVSAAFAGSPAFVVVVSMTAVVVAGCGSRVLTTVVVVVSTGQRTGPGRRLTRPGRAAAGYINGPGSSIPR